MLYSNMTGLYLVILFDSFFPDAEVIYVVSEVLAQFPEMNQQNYKVLLTHTTLLPAILRHCGIAADMMRDIYPILYSLSVRLVSNDRPSLTELLM